MVNGKPKPYDGYRAATEEDLRSYDSYDSEPEKENHPRDSAGKYSEDGEIIYGHRKPGVDVIKPFPTSRRIKRSPAEYYGGIYPHYDYSDPKHTKAIESNKQEQGTSENNHKQKKVYPKKHQVEVLHGKQNYNQYKYPKRSFKKFKKSDDSHSHATEENPEELAGQAEAEEAEEQKEDEVEEVEVEPHQYRYDNSFNIPKLKVRKYPYEKFLRDSKVASTKDDEQHEKYDEFIEDYEKYKKSLPSDLEKYFGSPEFEDKYTVAATQNLEKDKNCERAEKVVTPAQIASGKAKREASQDNQVCYICRDPKTGGSYEQCAYQTDPQSKKYFFGGSSSTNPTKRLIL